MTISMYSNNLNSVDQKSINPKNADTTGNDSKVKSFVGATERGTKIVKNNTLDKNAFLRILTAELTNQDPFNTKDSTAFVSQLAQFTQMEQMTNLNSTMTAYSAYSLVGKTVAFNQYDAYGKQYGGIVQNVYKNKDSIILDVDVLENGKYVTKQFDVNDISDVLNTYDPLFQVNNNMNFLMSSSLIGKEVEVVQSDGVYIANVKSVYKDGIYINLNVDIKGMYVKGDMSLDSGYSSEKVSYGGEYYGDKAGSLEFRYNKEKDIYECRIVKDGEDTNSVEWKEYKEGQTVEGMKFTLPKEKPSDNVTWKSQLQAVPVGERDVASDNILLIKNSDKK